MQRQLLLMFLKFSGCIAALFSIPKVLSSVPTWPCPTPELNYGGVGHSLGPVSRGGDNPDTRVLPQSRNGPECN